MKILCSKSALLGPFCKMAWVPHMVRLHERVPGEPSPMVGTKDVCSPARELKVTQLSQAGCTCYFLVKTCTSNSSREEGM